MSLESHLTNLKPRQRKKIAKDIDAVSVILMTNERIDFAGREFISIGENRDNGLTTVTDSRLILAMWHFDRQLGTRALSIPYEEILMISSSSKKSFSITLRVNTEVFLFTSCPQPVVTMVGDRVKATGGAVI